MWTDNLRQFHFWCQKTLPLVYDDSLSYYEVLAKVTKHLNELTTLVNEIGDELERYEGVTDNRLDTLETWRTEVDSWRAQIDQWKTIVENWREDVDQWREDIDLWQTSINNWKDAVELELTSIDNRLDTAESDIDSLEGRMDTAESDIDSIEVRMDTAEDDIDTLQSDVTSLDGRLDDAESDIASLDGRLDTAESDIDTLQSDVTSLDGRLDDAESAITSLDGRLDTAEDDIDTLQSDTTGLANRMSTAEDGISKIEERAFIIFGIVTYDSTNNIWLLEIGNPLDATFIRTNVDNSDYLLSGVSKKTQFIFSIGSSGYNYDNLVLSYGSTPLQYNGQNVVISILRPGTNSIWYKDFDTSGDTFILDTMPSNFAKINRLVSSNTLSIPTPTQNDDGKVVAYNDTLKNYELITPGGSSYNYSTTEHIIGKWTDGVTDVYEKTYTNVSITVGSSGVQTIDTIADIDKLIDAEGAIMEGANYYSLGYNWSISLQNKNVSFGAHNTSSFNNAILNTTIKYTKMLTP